MSNSKTIFVWMLRFAAALIMGQSLFFKFSAAPESIYIFSTLGMEPSGRIGTGIIELVACVLLLIPRYTWLGALLGLGAMSGAIFVHLTTLGIEVGGDGGQLFIYAIVAWLTCAALLFLERYRISAIINGLAGNKQ